MNGGIMPKQFDGLTLYTPAEVADRLGVQVVTVRRYLKEGKLAGRKFAGNWYVSAEAIADYFRVTGKGNDRNEPITDIE